MKHLLVWQHHLLQLFDRENQVHQLLLLTNIEVMQLRWEYPQVGLQIYKGSFLINSSSFTSYMYVFQLLEDCSLLYCQSNYEFSMT